MFEVAAHLESVLFLSLHQQSGFTVRWTAWSSC